VVESAPRGPAEWQPLTHCPVWAVTADGGGAGLPQLGQNC
jgi:hypothetical protein